MFHLFDAMSGIWLLLVVLLAVILFVIAHFLIIPAYLAKAYLKAEFGYQETDGAYREAPETSVWHQYLLTMQEDLAYLATLQHREVEIVSEEGFKLRGTLYSPQTIRGIVLFLHEHQSAAKREFASLARFYLDQGYQTLILDLRAHQGSEGQWVTMGLKEAHDLDRWLTWVHEHYPDQPIILHGHGLGAATVIFYLSQHPTAAVKLAVIDEAYADYLASGRSERMLRVFVQKSRAFMPMLLKKVYRKMGIDLRKVVPLNVIDKMKTPVLFFCGKKDWRTAEDGEALYQACGSSKKRICLINDADHGEGYYRDQETYQREITQMLEE